MTHQLLLINAQLSQEHRPG